MAAIKQLAAVTRSGIGKGAARSVRREGRVPAVIYGGGVKPEPISVDYKDVNQLIYSGGFLTSIFELEVEGREPFVLGVHEGVTIPRGVLHHPRAHGRTVLLMVEPAKVIPTGND